MSIAAAALGVGLAVTRAFLRQIGKDDLVAVVSEMASAVPGAEELVRRIRAGNDPVAHQTQRAIESRMAVEFREATRGDITAGLNEARILLDDLAPTEVNDLVTARDTAIDRILLKPSSIRRLSDPVARAVCRLALVIGSDALVSNSLGDIRFTGERVVQILAYLERQSIAIPFRTTETLLERLDDRRRQQLQAVVAEYRRQVHLSLLPEIGVLGRERERTAIAEFVRQDAGLAWWWQADPWSGKSALLADLALRPPGTDVDTVFFFTIARQADANNRESFLQIVLPQLAVLAGYSEDWNGLDAKSVMSDLLSRAADACERRGRRLLLIVDGLDEDTGPPRGQGSIASAIPLQIPGNVRLLVTSRLNPPLPDDVDDRHPLRGSAVARELSASEYGEALQKAAEYDLRELLKDRLGRDVLALVSAAQSGLTTSELAHLTRQPVADISDLLSGRHGRSLRPVDNGWQIAHQTLDDMLIRRIATFEVPDSSRNADWAEARRYVLEPWTLQLRERVEELTRLGWPKNSPPYLLGTTPLAYLDLAEQTDLVTNSGRLARMRETTRSHYQALGQLGVVAAALAASIHQRDRAVHLIDSDLVNMGRVTSAIRRLSDEAAAIDARTPALLVMAEVETVPAAVDLACSIGSAEQRAAALLELAGIARATAPAQAGLALGRALLAAAAIPSGPPRAAALTKVAVAFAAASRADQASAAVGQIEDQWVRDDALTQVALALENAGHADQAVAVTEQIENQWKRDNSFMRAALKLTAADPPDQAVAAAKKIVDVERRARALASVSAALAERSETRLALDAAEQALRVSQRLPGSRDRAVALAAVSVAMASARSTDRARAAAVEALAAARTVRTPSDRAQSLAHAAVALDSAGAPDMAAAAVEAAAEAAMRVSPVWRRASALAVTITALSPVGRASLAGEICDLAKSAALRTEDPTRRTQVLQRVTRALGIAGRTADAMEIVEAIVDASAVAQSLVGLARVAHQPAYARQAAKKALDAALAVAQPEQRGVALGRVSPVLASVGFRAEALEAATLIGDLHSKVSTLLTIATELDMPSSALSCAITVVADSSDSAQRVAEFARIAIAGAAAGEKELATQAAREALAAANVRRVRPGEDVNKHNIAIALAAAGAIDRGLDAALQIEVPHLSYKALSEVAQIAASSATSTASIVLERVQDRSLRDGMLAEISEGLAAAGALDEAVAAASLMRASWHRDAVLRRVALLLQASGATDAAVAATSRINDPREQGSTWRAITASLAEMGESAAAIKVAGRLAGPGEIADALVDVATKQADPTAARFMLDLAICVADSTTGRRALEWLAQRPSASQPLATLVADFQTLGLPLERELDHTATRLAEAMVDDQPRDWFDRWRWGSSHPEQRRVRALARLAVATVRAGSVESGIRIARECHALARTIERPGDVWDARMVSVRALASAGAVDDVFEVLADPNDSVRTIEPLLAVSAIFATRGEVAYAHQAAELAAERARGSKGKGLRAGYLAQCAIAFVRLGDDSLATTVLTEAIETALTPGKEIRRRAEGLDGVFRVCTGVCFAEATVTRIERCFLASPTMKVWDPLQKASVLAAFAKTFGARGSASAAVVASAEIDDPWQRISTLVKIIRDVDIALLEEHGTHAVDLAVESAARLEGSDARALATVRIASSAALSMPGTKTHGSVLLVALEACREVHAPLARRRLLSILAHAQCHLAPTSVAARLALAESWLAGNDIWDNRLFVPERGVSVDPTAGVSAG